MIINKQKTPEETYASSYAQLIRDSDLVYDKNAPIWKQIRRAANCFMEFSGLSSSRSIEEEGWVTYKDLSPEEFQIRICLSSHALPLLVNAAFALELFLRAILVFEGKNPGTKHNTRNLFTRIDKKTRELVVRTITKASNESCKFVPDAKEFDAEFEKISRTFVDGRYYYEKMDAPFLKQHYFLIITLLEILFKFTNRKMERFYKNFNIVHSL